MWKPGDRGRPIAVTAPPHYHLTRTLVRRSRLKTLPLSEVKAKLSELVNEVESRDARVVITRRGRPAAVLVSHDDLESWQETVEITSDPEFMAQIRSGLRDLKEGRASRLSEPELDGLLGPSSKKRSPKRSVKKGRPSPRGAR